MVDSVGFEGANTIYSAPTGMEDEVYDLATFSNGNVIICALKFTDEEMEQIRAAGNVIWVSHMGTYLPPFLVSSTALVQITDPNGTVRPSKTEPIIKKAPLRKPPGA